MAMRRCLGRRIGRGRGFLYNRLELELELESSRSYYAAAAAAASHGYFNYNSSCFSSFNFSTSHRWIHSSENPKTLYNNKVSQDVKGGLHSNPFILTKNFTRNWKEPEDDDLIGIKIGEIVNLSDLLFTESRDYLIKCNDGGQQVKAKELAGKVVVIYFDSLLDMDTDFLTCLMDIYSNLQHNSGFEVVFVNVDDDVDSSSGEMLLAPSQGGPHKHFEDIISRMPWTAIPLSDIASRKRLKSRFGVPERLCIGTPVVVDSTGMILQSLAYTIFRNYGALGYPFSDERIDFLESEDYAAARQPSLKTLLASPQRDYLITNKEDKVPIHTLEDTVVALYFYNKQHLANVEFTLKLKGVYEELAKSNKKFEVVLIYICEPSIDTKDSFWKLFKTMPWLALPIGDSNYKKLERIFFFPWDRDIYGSDMRLVVFGPHMEFIEPFGSDILELFKTPAYPFSREKVAMLAVGEAKKLKLEMLWDPNSVFGENYGSEVSFSQLVGKRVLIFFDKGELNKWEAEFLETLKDRYIQMKGGTDDEFEVIHITALSSKIEHVANLPWFVQPRGRDDNLFDLFGASVSLIAFDRNRRLVRKAVYPSFEDTNFPFYAGGLEKEALSEAVALFGWDRYHDGFPGMIYSYRRKCDKSI